jgi:hypothetical protein
MPWLALCEQWTDSGHGHTFALDEERLDHRWHLHRLAPDEVHVLSLLAWVHVFGVLQVLAPYLHRAAMSQE